MDETGIYDVHERKIQQIQEKSHKYPSVRMHIKVKTHAIAPVPERPSLHPTYPHPSPCSPVHGVLRASVRPRPPQSGSHGQ